MGEGEEEAVTIDLTPVFTSWPVPAAITVILVLAIFRRALVDLIARIRHVRAPGTAIDATGQKTPAQSTPTEALLRPEAGEAPVAKTDARTAVDELLRRLPRTTYFTQQEEALLQLLKERGIADDPTQMTRALLGIAAHAMTIWDMEMLYNSIFGSQIRILEMLNTSGARPISDLRAVYDEVAREYSSTFDGYPFERYLAFLQNAAFVEVKEQQAFITLKGRTFLVYLAHEGKSTNRFG